MQRGWLHHTEGHAGGAAAGDPRGARPEVGGGAEATIDSSPASRLTVICPGNRTSPRGVRRLNFRFGDQPRTGFPHGYKSVSPDVHLWRRDDSLLNAHAELTSSTRRESSESLP